MLAGVSDARLQYVVGDLRSAATVDRILEAAGGPMDVVHLAAAKMIPNDADKALEAFAVNTMASISLCMRVWVSGMMGRFVHVSTQSVFGRRPPTAEPIAEDAAMHPTGFYGYSKAAGEMGVLAIREAFPVDLVAVRITGIFGWGKRPANVVDRLFDATIGGEPISMPSGSADEYDMTYVKDTVRGILAVLHASSLRHPVYHVSRGKMTTLGELADLLRALVPTAKLEIGPGRSGAWPRTPLDVSRVADECGFRSTWEVGEAAGDFLESARSNRYGPEVELD
jgi:UDP-glucose 4-epimerase